jgi:hypothetical protein
VLPARDDLTSIAGAEKRLTQAPPYDRTRHAPPQARACFPYRFRFGRLGARLPGAELRLRRGGHALLSQRPERALQHAERLSGLPGRRRLWPGLRPAPAQVLFRARRGRQERRAGGPVLDPDEDGLHNSKIGSTKLLHEISKLEGPYGSIIRKANCCVDAWWPDPSFLGTDCSGWVSRRSDLQPVTV